MTRFQLTDKRIDELTDHVGVFTLERAEDLRDVHTAMLELQEYRKSTGQPAAYQYRTFDPEYDEWSEWEDCGECAFEQFSAEALIPDSGIQIRKLYAAPQTALTAPEIVPESLRDEIIDLCAGYEIGDQGAQEIWEACRAVMLNGGKQ